jgi:hypothetical protein
MGAVMGPQSFSDASEVRVRIRIGRLDILASERPDVSVSIQPTHRKRAGDQAAAAAVHVERIGNAVSVIGPSKLNLFGPGDSVDVVIGVPLNATVDAEVTYGSLGITGAVGRARLAAPYGEVSVERAARLELHSGHGDVRVEQVDGEADISSKSGSVRIGQVAGELRLKGTDTNLRVDLVDGPADISTSSGSAELGRFGSGLTVRAAYGNVRIGELVRGATHIEGSYGNVQVGVRRGTAVWLDVSSSHGKVRTDLAADGGPAEGEDSLELRVHTGYGNITIQRSTLMA